MDRAIAKMNGGPLDGRVYSVRVFNGEPQRFVVGVDGLGPMEWYECLQTISFTDELQASFPDTEFIDAYVYEYGSGARDGMPWEVSYHG